MVSRLKGAVGCEWDSQRSGGVVDGDTPRCSYAKRGDTAESYSENVGLEVMKLLRRESILECDTVVHESISGSTIIFRIATITMSSIAAGQKRKRTSAPKDKLPRQRKNKRAQAYHSSSEEDEEDVNAAEDFVGDEVSEHSEDDGIVIPNLTNDTKDEDGADAEEQDSENDDSSIGDDSADSDDSDAATSTGGKAKRNRNDPSRLATSISTILGSKLTTTQRADPILARSKQASEASKEVSESRLETKARRKLRDEKRQAMEKGRVKDVLALDDTSVSTAAVAEEEKRLRKMAQRGVVKLFNAVRAAQVKGEQAARDASGLAAGGTETMMVGVERRKEKVNEMSKKGFLDLLAGGAA